MSESNPNARIEAFCDGVFAIALTLLIIDIKIPATAEIHNTHDFWIALWSIVPAILAFVLSFVIILITWVNHHASLKMASKSSAAFIYSNGLLLLSVVFLPFPTSLLGEYLLTDHASPAVILYNLNLSFQSVGWIFICTTSLKGKLYKREEMTSTIRTSLNFGYFAFALYAVFAILAIWFPFTIAIVTILSWIIWLVWGLKLKQE